MGRLGVARYTTRTLHGSAMLGPSQPKHTGTVYGDDENWNKDRLAWAQRLLLYLAHGAQQVPLADVPVGSHGIGDELHGDPGKRLRAALGRAEQPRSGRRARDTGGGS